MVSLTRQSVRAFDYSAAKAGYDAVRLDGDKGCGIPRHRSKVL